MRQETASQISGLQTARGIPPCSSRNTLSMRTFSRLAGALVQSSHIGFISPGWPATGLKPCAIPYPVDTPSGEKKACAPESSLALASAADVPEYQASPGNPGSPSPSCPPGHASIRNIRSGQPGCPVSPSCGTNSHEWPSAPPSSSSAALTGPPSLRHAPQAILFPLTSQRRTSHPAAFAFSQKKRFRLRGLLDGIATSPFSNSMPSFSILHQPDDMAMNRSGLRKQLRMPPATTIPAAAGDAFASRIIRLTGHRLIFSRNPCLPHIRRLPGSRPFRPAHLSSGRPHPCRHPLPPRTPLPSGLSRKKFSMRP